MLTLHWLSSFKKKSSAEQLATSSLDSRHNNSSKVNVVLVSQDSSSLLAGHRKQEVVVKGGLPVGGLQSRVPSHLQTLSCSGSSSVRQLLSRHSSNSKKGPQPAVQLPSGLGGAPKNRQVPRVQCHLVCKSMQSVHLVESHS